MKQQQAHSTMENSTELKRGDKLENKYGVWIIIEKTHCGYNARKEDNPSSVTTIFDNDLKFYNRV